MIPLAIHSKIVYTLGGCGIKWDKVERRWSGVSTLKAEVEHMFLGQFYHNLDDKGRLTVPSRFREMLASGGAYVMQGFEKNLMVLPTNTFEAVSLRIQKMSLTDPTARLLRRLLFSTADRVDMDKAGRILLPQFLRQSATLDTGVVVVGSGDYFEIWAPDEWSVQEEQLMDVQANANRFSSLFLSSDSID